MYTVGVTASRPGHAPRTVELSGPDDHTPDQMSALLLQAADAVQRGLGLPSSQAELIAFRGTFDTLSGTLDELDVEADSADEGMLGLVRRVSQLGNEVRRLRAGVGVPEAALGEHERRVRELTDERDRALTVSRTHSTVIVETRRRLCLTPETPDSEIPRIVGELMDAEKVFHRERRGMADTIREVRVALNVGQETRDSELGEIARAFRIGNVDPHRAGHPCQSATMLREVLQALDLPAGVMTLAGVEHARTAAATVAQRADRAEQAEAKLNDSLAELEELGRAVAAADGGAEPTSRDDLQHRVRRLVTQVERFDSVLTRMGLPVEYWASRAPRSELFETVERIADNSDAWISCGPKLKSMAQALRLPHDAYQQMSEDELSSIVAQVVDYSDRWLSLTPDQLACAFHNAFVERREEREGPRFEQWWRDWKPEDNNTQAEMVGFARRALDELRGLSIVDTPVQRWQQALNRVRLDAGLPMVPVEQIGDRSEFEQVHDLIEELNGGARSAPVHARHLAHMMFMAAQEVSARRGSEPIPLTSQAQWEEAFQGRRAWWLDVAEQTLSNMDGSFTVPTSLLPVRAEELGQAMYESGPNATPWEKVRESYTKHAQRVLDSLPSFAAPKSALPPVTPEQLARAMHAGRSALTTESGARPPLFMPTPWEEQGPRAQEWFTRVAEIALSELPQIARADAESEASLAAHMDAVTAELRQRLVILDRENESLEAQRVLALDSFRDIARVLGMDFGGADDVRALGETTATAVRQLRDEALNEGTWRSMYRGMLRGVVDLLEMPEETLDDPKAFGAVLGVELEKRTGKVAAFNFCAPAPEDWMVQLTRMDGDAEGLLKASIRHGYRVLLAGVEYKVDFQYTGALPQRPAGELLLPSVSPEQLARAWVEVPTKNGPGFPWGDVDPGMRESYVEHARAVVDQLSLASWSDLARQGRKKGLSFDMFKAAFDNAFAPRPGEFFTAEGKARAHKLPDDDAATVASAIGSLSGGRIRAVADQGSVLEQLRRQGEQLRGWEKRAERSREHHKLIAEALGKDEFVSPARLAEYAQDLRDEVLALRGANADKSAESLDKCAEQLAEALGRSPKPPLGGRWGWGDLIRQVSSTADWQRKAAARADDLRRALRMPEHVSWDALVSQAAQANNAVGYLQRKLGIAEQTYPGPLYKAVQDLVDRSQDLSRALGFNSGESWEDMIEFVTSQTAAYGKEVLTRNALAEIGRILNLPERAFPSLVVSSARELKDSVQRLNSDRSVVDVQLLRLFEACGIQRNTVLAEDVRQATDHALDRIKELHEYRVAALMPSAATTEVKRVRGAIETLLGAAGIELELDFTRPDVTVQKAGDAAAILRSWPDVLRGVDAFEGAEVEQPDEVEPLLRHYAEVFYKADRRGSATRAIERLLAAHRGEPLQDNLDTMYERLDKLINNLFEPLREVGGRFEVEAADYVDKQRFAEHVLLAFRKHEDGLRDALSAFDIGTPTLAEVPAMLKGYAKTYHYAGRYQAALHNLETLLSTYTGEPKTFDDTTLKQRFADYMDVVFEPVREVAAQYAVKQELGESRKVFADRVLTQVRGLAHIRSGMPWASLAEQVAARFESGPIRVTPTVPHEWCYGPNSIDPDPGKRWHIGCGGEVWTFEGVDVCRDCNHEWTDEEAVVSRERAEQFKAVVEQQGTADESGQDTES